MATSERTQHKITTGLAMAQQQPCLLCGSAQLHMVAMFIVAPDAENRDLYRVPEGKERAVFYGLCKDCFNRSDKVAAVESKIQGQVS